VGALLGEALGDALGLPFEGMRASRVAKLRPRPLRHALILGRGMVSDDTEHAFFVARSFARHPKDAKGFQRSLAWALRWWLIALPAGVGFGTARSILKLWLGVPARLAGVRSAGNGPSMRAPLLGALLADDDEARAAYVDASSLLTHRDDQAVAAARAIANVAAISSAGGWGDAQLRAALEVEGAPAEWEKAKAEVLKAAEDDITVAELCARMGLDKGVTGYAMHSGPVAIYAFHKHRDDFDAAIAATVDAGGDTDSVAAVTGGLWGAANGADKLPRAHLDRLAEWPLSVAVMRRAAVAAVKALDGERMPIRYPWWGKLPRNVVFLIIVLTHGFRRLLPPY
jgi:ADP-ribosylglycohydrolase